MADPAAAARLLLDRRTDRQIVTKLPPGLAPHDVAEAALVQHALARLMAALPPAGFKIGATTRQMQDYLGLPGPAAGFMPARSVQRSGATVRYADFLAPGVECELAVRLGADLPMQACTRESAGAAVAELFAAIEIVERRYADLAEVGTPTVIADQVFHAGCVLGDPSAAWRDLDPSALHGAITVAGTKRGEGVGADLLGHPLAALAWLAGSEEVRPFGGLRAGHVVMLGSVTPPIWLDGPCKIEVAFDHLAPVTVTLS